MSRYAYDYYVVDIPEDYGLREDRFVIALNEARERTRLWVMPCEWQIHALDGDLITVRRKRYRRRKAV